GEFGDVLFSLVNYARFTGINPETALEKTCRKFIRRFQHMEEAAGHDRKKLQDMSLAEMDAYWEAAKNE
ncbi:MAG: nucleoside triphosphate pyrophosphohydrolase, partial [Gammaproteobacteria bacterium]|nr:nucleoside triphosphate pyrophosphohydrolase [Gammaproteobacteria bacterium]